MTWIPFGRGFKRDWIRHIKIIRTISFIYHGMECRFIISACLLLRVVHDALCRKHRESGRHAHASVFTFSNVSRLLREERQRLFFFCFFFPSFPLFTTGIREHSLLLGSGLTSRVSRSLSWKKHTHFTSLSEQNTEKKTLLFCYVNHWRKLPT